MKDLRQSLLYVKYIKSLGWSVENIDGVYFFVKKLPLFGSVIKIQRPGKRVTSYQLLNISKKYRLFNISIEPKNEKQTKYYIKNGFKKTKSPSLPSKTIHFNLLKSEKMLLAAMHHKTRYNIGLSKRRGVKVVKSNDIEKFADFWQKCAKKRGMFLSQKKEIKAIYKAFKQNAIIFDALHSNELIASVLILFTKDTAYYMYAASTQKGNKLFAPTLLVWEAIRYSKKRGAKVFDFEGIYDERFPLKTWKGFTRFKKGFGGKDVEYPGPLRKYYLPI